MSPDTQNATMPEGRALLSDAERDAIAGEASDSYRYKTRNYFRRRLDRLAGDVEWLEEHDPELLEELRDVVCEESGQSEDRNHGND